ncbi:MAG: ABC transporter permease [Pseudomonadota bacterium]
MIAGPTRLANRARRALSRGPKTAASAELLIGTALAATLLLLAALGDSLTAQDPSLSNLRSRLLPVGHAQHILGTDQIGRDILARLLAGLSWSLSAALASTAIALSLGVALGLMAAAGGRARKVIGWVIDTIIALPGLVIAICIIAVVGQGWLPMVLTLGLLGWPVFARVVMAEALSLMERTYVVNARLQGVATPLILLRHVLPGMTATLLVMTAFQAADMLIAESALSFLGIGAPLGAPTWGNMLAEARQYLIRAPWLVFAPGLAIIITVLTANLLGDGLGQYFRGRGPAPLL